MNITDIRIRRVTADGKLRAYVTVTFDECFVVHNVKIIEGKSGAFIAMPSRETKIGEYKDVAHPITPEFRNLLQEAVLAAFESEKSSEERSASDDSANVTEQPSKSDKPIEGDVSPFA